jgi:6-phosphogluconolactonase
VNGRREISVSKDPEQLSHRAATTISDLVGRAIQARGISFVALAGGETPARVYALLASDPLKNTIDWRHVHVFFGDERMVPPDDPASNYGMVQRQLLSRIPIPVESVHRIRGEASAADASKEYEAELQKWFNGRLPRFDIVVLGVGEDGHTASLFPGTDSLRGGSKMAIGYYVPQLKSWRVTLTLRVLLNARDTIFLAAGKQKAPVIARILGASETQSDLPASMVISAQGTVLWMLDEEAASLIPHASGRPG